MFSMQSLVVALRSGVRGASPLLRMMATLAEEKSLHELQIQEQAKRNAEEAHLTELIRDFLNPSEFYQALRNIDIEFFCGVPDSLLKDFCAYVTQNVPETHHMITANEGNAIGLMAGYHLATGKTGLVYLQNSGLGNTVNPLLSLAAPEVYSIPMLLMIGWRGEPGKRDEPQHMLQGQVTPGMLNSLGIPFSTLPDFIDGAKVTLEKAKKYMDRHSCPYALLVKRQTFLPYKLPKKTPQYTMTREQAVHGLVDGLTDRDIVISTTGMLSRELFEYRVACEQGHERDFLTVGSMGHASSIALGIALNKPSRQVFCIDGDGAVIMHMGTMSTVGQAQACNFKHVVINNGAHDSVGGQHTAADHSRFSLPHIAIGNGYLQCTTVDLPCFSLPHIAIGHGYLQCKVVTTEAELAEGVEWLRSAVGPVLLEVKVRTGSRKELGRPSRSPIQNKMDFMNFLAIRSYDRHV